MSKIKIRLANEQDDLQLRECIKRNEMEGEISLSFETEPSFFDAISVQGRDLDVIVGEDEKGIQGFGIRAIKSMYVNGALENIGYLSGLRVNPDFRRNIWLARGYQFFRDLDSDRKVPFYLTTIISDNQQAKSVLESGKAGLPKYQWLGRFETYYLSPQKIRRSGRFELGSAVSEDELFDFIRNSGIEKQFFPEYKKTDIGTSFLRGLKLDDFFVARKRDRIVGVEAYWDQMDFKQTRVVKYDRLTKLLRPIINSTSSITGFPRLPQEGQTFSNFYCGMPLSHEPEILRDLISYCLEKRNHKNMVIGFSESDSLKSCLDGIRKKKYLSDIYLVSFEGIDLSKLNKRVPYLEVGSL